MLNLVVVLLLFHYLLIFGNCQLKFYVSFFDYISINFRFPDNPKIHQATKHLKQYDRNAYKFEIKHCIPDEEEIFCKHQIVMLIKNIRPS